MTNRSEPKRPDTPVAPPSDFYDQDDSDGTCYLCGKPNYRLLYEVRHYGFPFRFQKCQCGIVKQTPMPNARFFDWFFNSQLFYSAKSTGMDHVWGFFDVFNDEDARLATGRLRVRNLRRILTSARPRACLEIGCSTGSFVHILREHGHDARGCDLSADFAEAANRLYGVHVDVGRFEEMEFPDASLDIVFFFNVMENLPNPAEFLTAVRKALKSDGHVVFNFVNLHRNWLAAWQKDRYFLWRPPVCYAYDKTVMTHLLEKVGLEVIEMRRDVRSLHLEKIFPLLGWRRAHAVARWLGVDRISFPIHAYPSLLVVAKKAEL